MLQRCGTDGWSRCWAGDPSGNCGCGAKLVYPSGAIQHAGIALGIGEGSGHIGRGQFASDLWRWLELRRNVSAVTGACMVIRRDVFVELNGFDTAFAVNYNDVDLCLRARAAGYKVVYRTGGRPAS